MHELKIRNGNIYLDGTKIEGVKKYSLDCEQKELPVLKMEILLKPVRDQENTTSDVINIGIGSPVDKETLVEKIKQGAREGYESARNLSNQNRKDHVMILEKQVKLVKRIIAIAIACAALNLVIAIATVFLLHLR